MMVYSRSKLLILLVTLVLVSGCSSKFRPKQYDGPPKHIPKNLLRTPNAVPKLEPKSRRGNYFGKSKSNSYVARKRRYHVMHSSKGYRARGLASWYGTKFHGRKTSSGEHYNMFDMTAAHRTLPLPSYVKVTNLHNQKSVIVKVNDRGPFHGNRLIDLSYVAAAKLGMLGHGTAHVEIKSIDPRDHAKMLAKKPSRKVTQRSCHQERPTRTTKKVKIKVTTTGKANSSTRSATQQKRPVQKKPITSTKKGSQIQRRTPRTR
jgi:rare lipoprotein A